jgi:sugar phosphate isomerase/epimerase
MSRVELLASYWTICGGAEPHTDQEYSPFSLRERAEAASKAGFTGLGLWHADLVHLRRQHGLPEMRRILEDNGIRHLELEFLTRPTSLAARLPASRAGSRTSTR